MLTRAPAAEGAILDYKHFQAIGGRATSARMPAGSIPIRQCGCARGEVHLADIPQRSDIRVAREVPGLAIAAAFVGGTGSTPDRPHSGVPPAHHVWTDQVVWRDGARIVKTSMLPAQSSSMTSPQIAGRRAAPKAVRARRLFDTSELARHFHARRARRPAPFSDCDGRSVDRLPLTTPHRHARSRSPSPAENSSARSANRASLPRQRSSRE